MVWPTFSLLQVTISAHQVFLSACPKLQNCDIFFNNHPQSIKNKRGNGNEKQYSENSQSQLIASVYTLQRCTLIMSLTGTDLIVHRNITDSSVSVTTLRMTVANWELISGSRVTDRVDVSVTMYIRSNIWQQCMQLGALMQKKTENKETQDRQDQRKYMNLVCYVFNSTYNLSCSVM